MFCQKSHRDRELVLSYQTNGVTMHIAKLNGKHYAVRVWNQILQLATCVQAWSNNTLKVPDKLKKESMEINQKSQLFSVCPVTWAYELKLSELSGMHK